jgi:hypothetical protein
MPQLDTPLLFLIFNRPEETARVFAAIRAQQPRRLFIASDGPRADRAGEAAVVARTREVASQVDWPCAVQTLFRDTNLGCGAAVSQAIGWFFTHVEEGIILEDDCLPHPDFFRFCEVLLERYRDDPRVATIGGSHCLSGSLQYAHSHYSSKYFQMWGWASWRRFWRHYDFTLQGSEEDWVQLFRKVHPIEVESGYWREIYRSLKSGLVDTWDFQVFFQAWKQGACHLMPGKNLVSNIGYGPAATHTVFESSMANMPVYPLTVAPGPIRLQPDPGIDNLIFYLRFLESMTHTWWVDQVLSPDQKLGHARAELAETKRQLRQLQQEVMEKRRQLLAATRALAGAAPA